MTLSCERTSFDLIFNPSNGDIYVANFYHDSVLVIDSSTNNVIENITVGTHSRVLEYNPFNENVHAANSGSNTVSVIDISTNSVIDTIDVGYNPRTLQYNL